MQRSEIPRRNIDRRRFEWTQSTGRPRWSATSPARTRHLTDAKPEASIGLLLLQMDPRDALTLAHRAVHRRKRSRDKLHCQVRRRRSANADCRKYCQLSSCYLLLEVDGLCSCQLWKPISCQCRSSLFLNVLIDGASTTSCGSLFHSLTIRKLKKFCLTVVWHLGLNSFNECLLSPLVTSASSKNLL